MRLERLILNDFLTYEHLDYEFESKPLLVQGLNLTDDGQTTNGTGKSGLQTGIEQCITASNSRDVRDNEIITYGKKQARAQLYASCDVRKERLHIDWDIKLSGSNVLRLKVCQYGSEEWTDVSFSNVNDGKKSIMDWFAISREDLFNYYIINNTRFKSFFKSSNTDKVALINRFSDASIIEGIENIDISELEEQYSGTQTLIDQTKGKVELVEDQIMLEEGRDLKAENRLALEKIEEEIEEIGEEVVSLLGDIETTKEKTPTIKLAIKVKKDLKKSLDADTLVIEADILKEEEKLVTINIELEESKRLVDEFKGTDWDKERGTFKSEITKGRDDLKPLLTAKKLAEEQEAKILAFLKGIEVTLSGSISCPKCSHEFILDGDIDELKEKKSKGKVLKEKVEQTLVDNKVSTESIKDSISELETSISAINVKEGIELESKSELSAVLNSVSRKVNEITRTITSLNGELRSVKADEAERLRDIKDLEKDLSNVAIEVGNIQKEIDGYTKEIKVLQLSMGNLKVGNNLAQIKSLKKDLIALNETLGTHRVNYQVLGDQIYEKNQWMLNFKQFRMHLANQSLGVIEYHCNRYLDEMGSDLTVKMEGFKVRANGTIKEEINATIIRGIERTFSSFSGGERGRLLFASILANRFMINETHPYGGLDFLGVDEVFEGVDASGLESLIESAKLLDIPVMIITHVSIEEGNDNVLTIVKENDVSIIK
jgi:hypothetical protein